MSLMRTVVIASLMCWATPAIAAVTQQCYYIKQAALIGLDYVKKSDVKSSPEEASVARLLGGHQVVPGTRTVMIVRRYFDGDGVYDADNFTKLSIELPEFESPSAVKFNIASLTSYFSRGGSSWAHKGSGVRSSSLSGSLTILNSAGAWEIIIEMTGKGEQMKWGRSSAQQVMLKETCKATELQIGALTPWLGSQFGFNEWRSAAKP